MNQTLQTVLVNYLSERGEPCGFEELWVACGPHSIGEVLGDEVIEAQRKSLRYILTRLVQQKRLHTQGERAERRWFTRQHEPVVESRIAQPRRPDVMRGGLWRPDPAPVMRPGADDHCQYHSLGLRC